MWSNFYIGLGLSLSFHLLSDRDCQNYLNCLEFFVSIKRLNKNQNTKFSTRQKTAVPVKKLQIIQNVYLLEMFFVRVIMFHWFYENVKILAYHGSIWVKKMFKKVPIYSEKLMKSKNWMFNVDMKKKIHIHAVINDRIYAVIV